MKEHERLYKQARYTMLKEVVVIWLRNPDVETRAKVHRVWKHAEDALMSIWLERGGPVWRH